MLCSRTYAAGWRAIKCSTAARTVRIDPNGKNLRVRSGSVQLGGPVGASRPSSQRHHPIPSVAAANLVGLEVEHDGIATRGAKDVRLGVGLQGDGQRAA